MPPQTRLEFSTSWCLALLLLVIISGCASPQKARNAEVLKDQMDWLQTQFKEQDGVLRDLREELRGLRTENRALRQKLAAAAKAPVVPRVKLTPEPVESEERAAAEDAEEEGDESVSSSDHAEMQIYFNGTRSYTAGEYDQAANAFRKFLEIVPGHVYADRAQYWLVQSHYSNKEYAEALVQANKMVSLYPHSFRLAEVMVLRASSLVALGQTADGRLMFREFLKRFPNHELSDTVSRRLAEVSSFRGAPPLLDGKGESKGRP